MSTQERPRLVTVDEYMRLDDDRRYELIDGALLVTRAATPEHQEVVFRIARFLAEHVEARDLGKVFIAPLDVVLGPHTVLQPDVFFVSRARLGIIGRKNCEGAPDLAVEVLSPGTRSRDLDKKRRAYAAAGVPHYWIVDPASHEVVELRTEGSRYGERSRVAGGPFRSEIFPDLAIDVDALFAL